MGGKPLLWRACPAKAGGLGRLSLYQRNRSFQEKRLVKIINCANQPYESAAALLSSADFSIPTMAVYSGTENQLAPAIVNAEVVDLFYAYSNRPDDII